LIHLILTKAKPGNLEALPHDAQVRDLLDDGMGGIRFVHANARTFGKEIARAEYSDSDGTSVSITLNADDQGDLFELDFWKVDFSQLKRYPLPEDVRITM
jgi:hypothetical protein